MFNARSPPGRRRQRWIAIAALGMALGVALGIGVFVVPADGLRDARMILLPAGSFVIGADDVGIWEVLDLGVGAREPTRRALEPHSVAMDSFWIDQTEVTVAAYERCVAAGTCTPSAPGWRCSSTGRRGSQPDKPINCVSHTQAESYCRFVGKELPTEEQWEYAARGPAGRLYPWGNTMPDDSRLCWKRAEPCDVGSYPRGATPEGILDLAGNVWEITRSPLYARDAGPATDYFVARGGPLEYRHDDRIRARASFRAAIRRFERDAELGFRCVRSARP